MVHTVWRGTRTVLVVLNNRGLVGDDENTAYLEVVVRLLEEPGVPRSLSVLAISDGGVPTARQRTQITRTIYDRVGDAPIPWVLVSSSRLARGVANALAFLHRGFRAYAPAELRRALRFLQIPDGEVTALWRAVRELDQQIHLETIAEIGAEPE